MTARSLFWTLALISLVGMTGATNVAADSHENESEKSEIGLYVGGGVGFGFNNFDGVPSSVSLDPAYGFDVWTGYRFHRLLAAELQLEYLNGFSGGGFGGADVLTFTGNAKLFPLGRVFDRLDPFATVGVGFEWLGAGGLGTTAFVARFGGGLDLYLTDHLALTGAVTYVLPTGDLDGGDYVGLVLGAQYRF